MAPAARASAIEARAKVNMTLHVVGRHADGLHRLDSLVVFPAIADRVAAEPADGLSLSIDGPFAAGLSSGPDNLALRAASALSQWAESRGLRPGGAALRLSKNLPLAGGVGGGSADAAAVLRLLAAAWELPIAPPELDRLGFAIGADLPVCLRAPRSSWMRGVGDQVAPAPAAPECWLLLVNPGVESPTGAVFAALDRVENPAPPAAPQRFADFSALVDWLAATRNDLTRPALALRPEIGDALAALAAAPDCRLARMSGSGATCFGLFEHESQARAAERRIRAAAPGWWAAAAALDARDEAER